MKCLIIAAGQGTRLRELAESKPLAPVAGRPLIEHVVRLARAGGASSFVVATGYRAEPLEAYVAELAERLAVPIQAARNVEWERPNGASVLAAAELLGEEDYVLLMSDHLFDPAILAALIATRRAEAGVTLAVDRDVASPLIDLDDATKVKLGPDRRIAAIGKTLTDYDAIDTGIFLATPALAGAIRDAAAAGGTGSLSEGVQRLAEAGTAWAMPTAGEWWADVDDAAALARAEETMPERLALS